MDTLWQQSLAVKFPVCRIFLIWEVAIGVRHVIYLYMNLHHGEMYEKLRYRKEHVYKAKEDKETAIGDYTLLCTYVYVRLCSFLT